MHKEKAIINIALDAGLESHESFSRAFKQIYGQSSSEFRRKTNWESFKNILQSMHIKGEKIIEDSD